MKVSVRFVSMLLALLTASPAAAACLSNYIACYPPSSLDTTEPSITLSCVAGSLTTYDSPNRRIRFSAPGELDIYRRFNV